MFDTLPPDDHASRTRVLAAMAGLLGFHGDALSQLPDGSTPDVLRFDVDRRGLFVGDAKHAETPGCVATAVRFRRYMRWVRAHQRSAAPGVAVVAICFSREHEAAGWLALVKALGADVGVPGRPQVWVERLDTECHLVVLAYEHPR